jgi:tetratricopeptide (TPR) repeat protein
VSRLARVVAAAALGGLLAAGCSSDEKRFAEHLRNAEEYVGAGKQKEALIELRSALQIEPQNADVNFRIAELMRDAGRYGDALFFFRETTRLDPGRTDAALEEAKLSMFDDPKHAQEIVDRVLEAEPQNPTVHIRRSEVALARVDSETALAEALTAVELAPEDGMAHMQLGIVSQARIREKRLAGEAPPEDFFVQAQRAFENADRLFGGGVQARVELGRLYGTWPGHDKEAEATLRSAVEVAPEGEPRGRAAGVALSFAQGTGNVELQRWALESMVVSVPGSLRAWADLARVEERREPGKGEAVYRRLLELRPDDAEAHVRFARFLASRDRRPDAIAHLEEQAKSGSNPAVTLEALAAMYTSGGDIQAARAVVERLVAEYPTHPRTKLAQGRLALAENRNDEAAELLRAYVGSEDAVLGHRLLAMAELRRRNFPAAAAAADAAIQRETESPASLLRLKASIHEEARDWPQVLITFRRQQRLGIAPSASDQIRYARALYETGRGQLGRAVLEQLLATESPPVGAYLEYASRESERDPAKSAEYVDRVLQSAPRNPVALTLFANRAIVAGRPDDALAALDKAAETGPLSPQLVLARARILASKKDWTRAEEDARRAFAAAPQLTGALDLLAQIYAAQGRLDEAIASFEEAEKIGALPASGQVLLARLHRSVGHLDQAQALYEKALAQRSDLPGAKNDLAWLLAERGSDLERALTLAQEAQQAEPENPEFIDTLGYVYLRKGLAEPAVQQLSYAVELAEGARLARPQFHYHLGLALRAAGRNGDAVTAFERALAIDADFPEADRARSELDAARSSLAVTSG